MTINEAHLVALRATITLTYVPVSCPENIHKMIIMYELICAKMSIFPPKMAQETIQYGQEISQDGQETCHRVQESSLEHKLQ